MRVGIYARFSTDGQKATSIDDQIRTCRDTAQRMGFAVSDGLIFADAAVSGSEKGLKKREQYHALRAAVSAGQVDVIVCDQSCRLARHATEALAFFDELKSRNVRLLTADGFDSNQPTAQLLFGMKSVFSQFFLDETRHRVRRGMEGNFERGGMVTAVPYGYRVDAEQSAKAGQCLWKVMAEEATVVREIFSCRKAGMSFNQIAAILNGRRVPTPRDPAGDKGLYWRATAIWRILQNPLYKGTYQVNFGKGKSEKHSLQQRLLPALAMVTPADWEACQAQGKGSGGTTSAVGGQGAPRAPYGGGKHALAGVITCGVCGVPLSCHHAKTDSGSLHCMQCEHATAAGVPGRQPAYVSVKGVRLMLRWLLERVLAGEAVSRFRERLQARLSGGREVELVAGRDSLGKAARVRDRLRRLLGEIGDDDPALEQQYLRSCEEVLRVQKQVEEIEAGLRVLNQDAIRQQLDIDLAMVLDAFLTDEMAPERTRALLKRIFPCMVLLGKPSRYTAIFEVHVQPGAILAEASGTQKLAEDHEVMFLRLTTSGSKYPVWSVDEPPAPDIAGLGLSPQSVIA